MRKWWLLGSVLLLVVLLAGHLGCGGGGSAPGMGPGPTGSVQMTVVFPTDGGGVAPESLPFVTQSVLITLEPGGVGVFTSGMAPAVMPLWQIQALIVRPPGGGPVNAWIDNVPAGPVTVLAEAFASDDGSGDVIAWAVDEVMVLPGQVTDVHMITEALAMAVEVNPLVMTIEPQEGRRATATAYDADGNIIIGADFIWDSDDPGVAQVEQYLPAGVTTGPDVTVRGVADGTCNVTATETVTGRSDSCEVTVQSRAAASVIVDPAAWDLYIPDAASKWLTATAYDALDDPIPYADITWLSDDDLVATVDPTGLVQAQDEGLCQIEAQGSTATGSASGYCDITVWYAGSLNLIIE